MDAAMQPLSGDSAPVRRRRSEKQENAEGAAAPAREQVVETTRSTELPVATEVIDVVPRSRAETLNRALNVFVALVALILLSPVFLLVAIAVKLTSRGPIFYTQTRVGLDRRWNRTHHMYDRRTQDLGGAVFTIYKFRSMRADAERHGQAVWATRNDTRVTPIGQFLRKSRLDELPQLINVLKGDMNIVGPRPERPSIVLQLRSTIPEYAMRQRVKPGITGWAQINHTYDSCIEDVRKKVQFDLEYLRRQGMVEDLLIMAKTIPVMLLKKGGW
jgi:lipopolysaccharide/colanic/teichoic acid biosynthesis glycosyltransferase